MTETPLRPGWPGATALVAALLVAAWSAIPFAVWWDGADPAYFRGHWALWGWGLLLAALATGLVVMVSRGRVLEPAARLWHGVLAAPVVPFVATCAVLLALLAVLMCLFVFAGNPRNVDGFAQLFHARVFLAGRLWVPPPPEIANFATLHMIMSEGRWLSQYPPGQSVVLALGLAAGAWWLLNPLFAALLAWATWSVARWCLGESAARAALLLLLVSPFVVAVAGSEMSHLPAAALGMLAAALATRAGGPRGLAAAAGAGVTLGITAAFRPLDAVAAAAPVAAILLLAAPARVRALAASATGGVLASLPLLLFNQATTGSWRTFGYTYLWGPGHALGFHDVPWGEPLTLPRAVARSGLDLHQLNAYLFDAPLPATLLIAAGALVAWRGRTARRLVPLAGALSLVALLFAYWHRDVFYGPRFLFTAVPWFVILVAQAVTDIGSAGAASLTRGVARSAALLVAVAIAFGLVLITPGRIAAYRAATPVFALHPDRAAAREGITNAVVVIPDGWGQRLIVRMWALGVPVPRAGRLYAAIDACTLEQALAAAEQDGPARGRLVASLDSLAGLGRPGIKAGLTDDPNLRLPAPEDLTARCRDEIGFDRRGFLQYPPFLYLNNATVSGDIVWARDMRDGNAALFARHAGRARYRYGPAAPGEPPVFTRLAP